MANPHYYSLINRKINTLQRKAQHFAKSREDALKKIKILEDALFILDSNHDNYFLNTYDPIETHEYTYLENSLLKQSPRKLVAQVMRMYPNQWISTRDVVKKVFELEKLEFDEILYQPIRNSVSGVLRRQQERGILKSRRSEFDPEARGNNQSEWYFPMME
ncbi:hypothetical protein JP35_07920 [Gallibacterium anatis]|uniref:hypothetical protein n=1 Tax=Pasteurellaceae TaxID=712 RepID=UPI00053201A1|nr:MULTISPECIES: hypothetical protein [Pasteurellaceae]KGQ38749.1 hypothetical protein JP35_07920 [Gallibacterium anatis]WGE60020.1 hypothetical protein NYR73_04745 [Actinobacillus equuli subsp. haemolyticus]WGE61332.1 hypothetical protein NYR74_00690 [Actinobacillus equuli subsp. haemolyticus]